MYTEYIYIYIVYHIYHHSYGNILSTKGPDYLPGLWGFYRPIQKGGNVPRWNSRHFLRVMEKFPKNRWMVEISMGNSWEIPKENGWFLWISIRPEMPSSSYGVALWIAGFPWEIPKKSMISMGAVWLTKPPSFRYLPPTSGWDWWSLSYVWINHQHPWWLWCLIDYSRYLLDIRQISSRYILDIHR